MHLLINRASRFGQKTRHNQANSAISSKPPFMSVQTREEDSSGVLIVLSSPDFFLASEKRCGFGFGAGRLYDGFSLCYFILVSSFLM